MFTITKDYITNYKGDDTPVKPIKCLRLFASNEEMKKVQLSTDSTKEEIRKQIDTICIHRFRLYDGDQFLYFEGLSDDGSSFEPLDWAQPNYGCAEIRYLENGEWKEL